MKLIRWALLIVVIAVVSQKALAENRTGFLVRDTVVKSAASSSGSALIQLVSGVQIQVITRKGGWYQIASGKTQGWVKFNAIRFHQIQLQGSNGLSETAKLLTKDTTPTLTAGVKGLQEEDLQKAKPDYSAVELMETFAVNKAELLAFAKQGNL